MLIHVKQANYACFADYEGCTDSFLRCASCKTLFGFVFVCSEDKEDKKCDANVTFKNLIGPLVLLFPSRRP